MGPRWFQLQVKDKLGRVLLVKYFYLKQKSGIVC